MSKIYAGEVVLKFSRKLRLFLNQTTLTIKLHNDIQCTMPALCVTDITSVDSQYQVS